MAAKTKSRKTKRADPTAQMRMVQTLHQIWLAGLGAVSKAQHGAPQLLEDLINEGARVDAQARGSARKALQDVVGSVQSGVDARVSKLRGRAADAMENLENIFRTRVHRALTQLGVPSGEDIAALSKRVDALNANIHKLARQRKIAVKARPRSAHATNAAPPAA